MNVLTGSDNATISEIREFDNSISLFTVKRIYRKGIFTYFNRILEYYLSIKNIDVLVTSGKFPVWSINLLRFFFKKKILAVIHGTEVQLPNPISKKLFFAGLSRSNSIVAVSNFTKLLLPQNLQKFTCVIPNGIINNKLNSQHFGKNIEMQSPIRLLTVGNLTRRKGQHRVIKALPLILDKHPGCQYNIVGIPSDLDSITELARDFNILSHIQIHGKVSQHELSLQYFNSHIFIMLSENQPNGDVEGFGIAIIEANSYGIPAIGAKGCGIEDAIQDGVSGILVDGNKPRDILNAIDLIIGDYESFSAGALKWAKKHNWENVVKRYIGLL